MTQLKIDKLEQANSTLVITKAKSLGEGEFEAVLSTDDLDRHGEKVSIKGLAIPKDQVIKMYYNHQTYGDALPIGKWNKIWKINGKLMGQGEIDMEDDFAAKIYNKIKKGYIDTISIGFYPTEYDGDNVTWTKSTLVEASVVAEPANVAAKITSKELGFTQEDFTKSLKVKLKEAGVDTSVIDDTLSNKDDKDADQSIEIKAAVEGLEQQVKELTNKLNEFTEAPTKSNIVKVRLSAKKADKLTDELNRIIKVKLKESK